MSVSLTPIFVCMAVGVPDITGNIVYYVGSMSGSVDNQIRSNHLDEVKPLGGYQCLSFTKIGNKINQSTTKQVVRCEKVG